MISNTTSETKINKLSNAQILSLDLIKTSNPHLRLDSNTESLQESIKIVGLLTPLGIDENYNLIFGGRRYSALKALGWTEVPVIVLNKTDLQAELASLDENLERVNYKDRELDIKLHARKQIYEQLYPETKQHSSELASNSSSKRNDKLSPRLPSYVEDTANKTGESKRTIERAIRREECNSNSVKEARDKNLISKSHCDELTKLSKEEQDQLLPYIQGKPISDCSQLIQQALERDIESVVKHEEISNQLTKDITQGLPNAIKSISVILDRISSSQSSLTGIGANDLEGKLIALKNKIDNFILTSFVE